MMMGMGSSSSAQVYLALGATDMRKSINTLSIVVQEQLHYNPFSGSLFAFCNRRRDIVKVLYWDNNGFCLWQKRLEKDRLRWPESSEEVMKLSHRELMWLLDGMPIPPPGVQRKLAYETLY
ncbi:MAG: IS66 family insertion sequence element accessory protein TnpB [Deltaproteobacteria bacterium]|jgi:transposase|nr:IS66 family insertion sequence element accessory protein TnpB [Deltaproteobacteria bacterium]MDX9763192.1 IS66 family insertion sequence element accessory protein TnpB [Desulfomonilia bacterium]